jgi:hypothetical protein
LWQLLIACRRTPDAFSGDARRAEAETMDLDVATDLERARFAGVEPSHGGLSFELASPNL